MRTLKFGDIKYPIHSGKVIKVELEFKPRQLDSRACVLNNHPQAILLISLSFSSSTWCTKDYFQLHLLPLLAKHFTYYCHTYSSFRSHPKLHDFLLLFSLLQSYLLSGKILLILQGPPENIILSMFFLQIRQSTPSLQHQ